MNEAEFKKLLVNSWHRPLSPEEDARLQSWLATHPEAQHLWEEEVELNQLLQQLPDLPLSSNFTARVLQALDRESTAPRRIPRRWFYRPAWLGHWVPRLAGVTVLLILGLVGGNVYHQYHRQKLIRGVELVGNLAALPHPESLEYIETILQLPIIGPDSSWDPELVAALQ